MKMDKINPQVIEQLNAKYKMFSEAYNNNDAAALAAFFTEDAVLVTDTGSVYGREAIEKSYADQLQKWRVSNHIGKPDQYSPHIIGTAGDEAWSSGEWSMTLQPETGDPIPLKGHWSEIYVRDGDAWKVRMQTWNITPEPAAPAETK
jgi:ketosteroid isomerase-like protein